MIDHSAPLEPLTGAPAPRTDEDLQEYLSRPTAPAVAAMRALTGDLLVLGAGGKMGLSAARMARRALDGIGKSGSRVIAVSRFGDPAVLAAFEQAGIETIAADLLDDGALEALPDAENVLFLAGMKFGSSDRLAYTWAMNALLPGLVGGRFRGSRIVALSTGNVYPMVPVVLGGAREDHTPGPMGDYAQSCLARERMLSYWSEREGTPVALIRLNYANALVYGVLVDIAQRVLARQAIDLSPGAANVIWQGDANSAILGAFSLCSSPATILNVSGPETVSVRWAAERFAEIFDLPAPEFAGVEPSTAFLTNSGRMNALFGYPSVPLGQLVEWTAAWLKNGGRLLGKPTHFEVRDGQF